MGKQNGFSMIKQERFSGVLPVVVNPISDGDGGGGYETYANLASFPAVGDEDLFYIADDTKLLYYWDGVVYVETSPGAGGGDTLTSEGALINSAASKATPVDADMIGLMDSAAGNILRKLSWLNLKNTLKTYFDTIYLGINAVLTGFVSGAGTITAADTIKTAIQKLNGNIAGMQDITFTQPSASTTWTLVHGRAISPSFAFFNALNEREYPLEDHSVAGQVSLIFGVSEIHTATLPGNGTSASLRGDAILSLTGTAINAASGVIDIASAKTVIITVDVAITFPITFSTTPSDSTPLKLKYKKGATPFTASVDAAKFKDSVTSVHPSPMLLATANTEDVFDYLFSSTSGKMVLMGFNLGG